MFATDRAGQGQGCGRHLTESNWKESKDCHMVTSTAIQLISIMIMNSRNAAFEMNSIRREAVIALVISDYS